MSTDVGISLWADRLGPWGAQLPVSPWPDQEPGDRVNAVFPLAKVQACVIHLIRATLRYASRKYWAQLTTDLRRVYTRRCRAPLSSTAWWWDRRTADDGGGAMRRRDALDRVVAFTDGVFAIVITILVLELGVPPDLPERPLAEAIGQTGPELTPWVISFLLVGMFWCGTATCSPRCAQ